MLALVLITATASLTFTTISFVHFYRGDEDRGERWAVASRRYWLSFFISLVIWLAL